MTDEESIGQTLKRVREEKKLSLEDVRRATNIKPEFLAALEADSAEDFLPPVYARGFLRTYCDLLELDSMEILNRFRAQSAPLPKRVALQVVGPREPRSRRRGRETITPWGIIVVLLTVIVAVGIVITARRLLWPRSPTPPPRGTPTVTSSVPTGEGKTSGTAPSRLPVHITVAARENIRLKVSLDDDPNPVYDRLLAKNRPETWHARSRIRIQIEDASKLRLARDSRPVEVSFRAGPATIEVTEQDVRVIPPTADPTPPSSSRGAEPQE